MEYTILNSIRRERIKIDGVKAPDNLTIDYCWQLVQEYSILHNAQINVLLKKYSALNKNDRRRLLRSLSQQWHISKLDYQDAMYFANKPDITPTGRYQKQIACFWVLLDYFDKVSSHYATGTFTRISMEISKQEYSLVYVGIGDEGLCMANIQKSGDTLFIVIVEKPEQIMRIKSDKIRVFATVNEKGAVRYYAAQGGGLA